MKNFFRTFSIASMMFCSVEVIADTGQRVDQAPSAFIVRESIDQQLHGQTAEISMIHDQLPQTADGGIDHQKMGQLIQNLDQNQEFWDLTQQADYAQDVPPEVDDYLRQQTDQGDEALSEGGEEFYRQPRWRFWRPHVYHPNYVYPSGVYGFGYVPYYGYYGTRTSNYGYWYNDRFIDYRPGLRLGSWNGYHWSYFYRY